MGRALAVVAVDVACRSSSQVADAADYQNDSISVARWPAVADSVAMLSAGLAGAVLALTIAQQSPVAGYQPHTADSDARSARSRGFAQFYGYRQPECENDRKTQARPSKCCPAAESSNTRWHGSTETVASPRTSSRPSHQLRPGDSSFPSNSSPAASQDNENMLDNFESDSQSRRM
jgi:hypothetical protein